MDNKFKYLVWLTTVLALFVIVLGAYVRLKDAGLGCPDWPGCYGQIIGVPEIDQAGKTIDKEKAWIEVIHRYVAAVLGLMILIIAIISFVNKLNLKTKIISVSLLVLVIFQAILGALTVTELLKPIIVTSHLMGGMLILSTLVAFSVSLFKLSNNQSQSTKVTKTLTTIFAIVLFVQILLGGWVSTNYAGLACGNNFPKCGLSWSIDYDSSGFKLNRELGKNANGKPISQQALISIQWLHRLGALVLTISAIVLMIHLFTKNQKTIALSLLFLLLIQLSIGIYIVIYQLPLFASLLHNLGAALLVAWLVTYYIIDSKHKI